MEKLTTKRKYNNQPETNTIKVVYSISYLVAQNRHQ